MKSSPLISAAARMLLCTSIAITGLVGLAAPASAQQDRLPWSNDRQIAPYDERNDTPVERLRSQPYESQPLPQAPLPPQRPYAAGRNDGFRPPARSESYGEANRREPIPYRGEEQQTTVPNGYGAPGHDAPYEQPPPQRYERGFDNEPPPPRRDGRPTGTFSMREIRDAGHGFFGSISQGLASVIEYAFQKQGRPNGYILGEDVGGAFVAGLRYGEGTMYTKDAGIHKVYWQGPSIGYDAGAAGSKVMVLVYNMRDPNEIYHRFGGIDGSAYVIGGVGMTFQSHGDMVLAPIRAGIGLRLGANIGYLKYSRRPTWNPF